MGLRVLGVAMLLLVAAAARARADCKPAAVAQGDPVLVHALIDRLTATGIATAQTAGCPAVRVQIDQRGERIHLQLADGFQRTSEREVQDVATAAAIVESWTVQEIEAGTLPADVIAAPPIVEPIVPPLVATRHLVRTGLGASIVSALGSNGGTTWIGGALEGCVRIGAVCAGALVRGEADTRASGVTTTIDQSSYALAGFAMLDLPRRLGGFVVTPGIAVGYGWLHVTTHHHDAQNNPLEVPTSDHELRAGAHVALVRPWGDHLSVFADLWGDAAVVRSNSQFGPGGTLRLSFGLRFEAP